MWPRSLVQRSVGAGDVSLARSAARGVDAHDLTRAVHATLEAGIDLVDIAPEDDAERLVGDALRALRLRDRTLVITRVPALAATASGGDLLRERLPQRYLQDRIERSLRATRLDALPVVMLELRAGWRDSPTWPEFVDACARHMRDGKVLAYGAYIDRIEDDTAALLDESWLVALNVPFSLCERAAESVIAKALELRVRTSDEATSLGETGRQSGEGRRLEAERGSPSHRTERSTESLIDADPTLAAAAARDPNIAAVLASSLTGVSESGLFSGGGATQFTGVSLATDHALVDPRLAAKDPVVAAALARDPKLAAALGIELPRGSARDVAILARRPLAGGALAGTLGPGAKLRKDDDRKLDDKTLERIAVGVAKLAALVKQVPPAARSCDAAKFQLERNRRPAEDVECATLPELALRFAIDRGAIPLVRLQHREHVTDALAAAISRPLPRDLTENLDI